MTDYRTVRMILTFPKAAYDAYVSENGEEAKMLPSGVLIGDPNVSGDQTRCAISHEFSFDDLLAMRDWFGSVEIVKSLPETWYEGRDIH